MPKSDAVWGIDIGQCALKAVRCEPHESDPSRVVADEFDYIEYSKILSQPEADPVTLIREALELFLSRNTVRGDHVAISVSGQSGLARFIKLPPVESKKIPDIVKYEAKQQIPFSLDDVVWDYQQMDGGSEDEGFSLETEVGLFAMKRDVVFRALKPFEEAGIEVDFIQLAPLSIYNAVVFDQMNELPPPDEYDPEDPPESVVVISLGTDNTDLVVTNGYRLWQRNIPLGGNHFTKALSKELKLTFAKAEHLKRNAMQAEDPKAVFQAMRPVFNDLLTEVQRSIGFFTGIDRSAKIGRIVVLGNAMRLPGLQRFLAQNLGHEVTSIESYRGLVGGSVTAAPTFSDNLLSFGVCYGLCLQGLGKAKLKTNLLPPEIETDRLIRDKKPWAVIAVAALLAGLTINYLGHWVAWNSADLEPYKAETFPKAESVKQQSDQFVQEYEDRKAKFDRVHQVGKNLVSNVEGRLLWLEVLKAIDAALPEEKRDVEAEKPVELSRRRELQIESVDCQKYTDLAVWFRGVSKKYQQGKTAVVQDESDQGPLDDGDVGDESAEDATAQAAPAGSPGDEAAEQDPGPTGPGWAIEIRGHHYFNVERRIRGSIFVRLTLMKNLEEKTVKLPAGAGEDAPVVEIPIKDLGIGYPVLVKATTDFTTIEIPNDGAVQEGAPMGEGEAGLGGERKRLKRTDFIVQFCWKETPPGERGKEVAKPVGEFAQAEP